MPRLARRSVCFLPESLPPALGMIRSLGSSNVHFPSVAMVGYGAYTLTRVLSRRFGDFFQRLSCTLFISSSGEIPRETIPTRSLSRFNTGRRRIWFSFTIRPASSTS
jgi:hypothetical protein